MQWRFPASGSAWSRGGELAQLAKQEGPGGAQGKNQNGKHCNGREFHQVELNIPIKGTRDIIKGHPNIMAYTSSSSLDKSTQHFLHIMKGFCGHSFSRRLAIKSFDGLSLLWFLTYHVFGGDDNAFMIF